MLRPWLLVPAAALAAFGAFVLVNFFDQSLAPEARELFTRREVPFSEDSGWAVLAGFHAPPGEEARRYAAELRRQGAQGKPGQRRVHKARPLEVRAAVELLCTPAEMDCVRAFAARPDSIEDLVADNAILLARYQELLRSRKLTDVMEVFDYFDGATSNFPMVLVAQQVWLSQVGLRAAQGRHGEAIAGLEADAAFQRAWLEEAGSILTKLVAAGGLTRDLLLAGQIARSGQFLSAEQWRALDRIAAPLTPAQYGIAPVVRIEAALFADILDHLVADARTTGWHLRDPRARAEIASATVRRNATLSFAYPLFAQWARVDDVPTARLASVVDRIGRARHEHLAPDFTWLYNYAGKNFASEATDFSDYAYRLRDVDALGAAMRCVIAIHRDRTLAEHAAVVIASAAACVDPYEGRAFAWDPQNAEISFRPRSPRHVKRMGGRGDRVTFKAFG